VTPNDDLTVTLQWSAPSTGGSPTNYRVEAGTASGASNVLATEVGLVTTYRTTVTFTPGVTYYFRTRALNGSGVSVASNEVALAMPCPPPPAPQHVSWRPVGSDVQVVWFGVGSGVSLVEFGSSPGEDNVLTTTPSPGQNTNAVQVTLPPGSYYARVVNRSSCSSATAVSAEIVVTSGEPYGSSPVLINEIGSSGENALRFVELKNVSASPVNVQSWKILSGRHTVFHVTSLPGGTTLAPGCTYLVGALTDADINVPPIGSSSAALVDATGRIRDSVAARETESGTSPYVFAEGERLDSLSTAGTSYARVADSDSNFNPADFVLLTQSTPQNSLACNAGSPPAPSPLQATVTGGTVRLDWMSVAAAPPVSQYSLEVGLTPGATHFGPFFFDAAQTTVTFGGVPDGTYYARMRAWNANGPSPATNEVTIVVCWQACTTPPGPVTQLIAQVVGSTVLLAWTPPTTGGGVTGYVLEGGTAPGLSDLGQYPTGSVLPFVVVSGVPSGTYFVRVRAASGSTLGAPSNEVVVVVP
jgi:hypothetical protein